jgi:DNA-directed RNA polymerase III subunit RPC5
MDSQEDEIVGILPVHYANRYTSNIQLHQFPLLTRPLQAPPSAVVSGKRITARIKPDVHRLEVHVPADSRPEVWNVDRTKELGTARAEDDREKNQAFKGKGREDEEPRLSEVRLRSDEIPQKGVYMLGIVREGTIDSSPCLTTNDHPRQTSSSPD